MPDAYGLTDQENVGYDAKRRQINTGRDQQLAASAYGRFAGQRRFSRQREGNTQSWNANRMRLQSPLAQRGISNRSGIWQQMLRNFQQKRIRAENQFDDDEYGALREFDMGDANVRQSSADALLALEEQRQAQIRDALAALSGIRQFGVN